MSQNFQPGDYLVFQIEAAFGLLRLLEIEKTDDDTIWHLASYDEMFIDIDLAEQALESEFPLTVSNTHMALTNRAFESTQTARITNRTLSPDELSGFEAWKNGPAREVSDRSVRLLLGLR